MPRWIGLPFLTLINIASAAPYNDAPYEAATYYGGSGSGSGADAVLLPVILLGYGVWFIYVRDGGWLAPFLVVGACLATIGFVAGTDLGLAIGWGVGFLMLLAWWARRTRT